MIRVKKKVVDGQIWVSNPDAQKGDRWLEALDQRGRDITLYYQDGWVRIIDSVRVKYSTVSEYNLTFIEWDHDTACLVRG